MDKSLLVAWESHVVERLQSRPHSQETRAILTSSVPTDGIWRLFRLAFVVVVVVYLLAFAYYSVTRTFTFSDPDTMNFVDVARNIVKGRGIAQSTLGFNQPHFSPDAQLPTPLTAQPPLYPLLIAMLSMVGLSAAAGGLLLSAFGQGIIVLFTFVLARQAYDEQTGFTAVASLSLYFPLRLVASTAYSEPLAVALTLVSLALLYRQTRPAVHPAWLPLLTGLTTGGAIATRYAFLPLAVVGLGVMALVPQRKARDAPLYALGTIVPVSFVLMHNYMAAHTFLPPAYNPSTQGVGENLRQFSTALLGQYLESVPSLLQMAVLGFLLLALGIFLTLRRTFIATLRAVVISQGRYILALWALSYTIFLVYQRTRGHFDPLQGRFIVPVGVPLIILGAALLMTILKPKGSYILVLALVVMLFSDVRLILFIAQTAPYDEGQRIAQSERLSWIAQYTTSRDLIIGDDTVYVPFYFGYPAALSFSSYPYTDYLDYGQLIHYANKHCGEYEHMYIVLGTKLQSEEQERRAFGSFIADITSGRTEGYPGVLPLKQLTDGYIFRLQCA